jgi:hypothetical protein
MNNLNIHIKANVNNITLFDIYELLAIYTKTKQDVIKFKGYNFKIETEIGMSINYIITELI